ncbi:MAG: hypothetical protein LBU31_00195 [Coriobacteriales bacterium]|jgi:uncharacterized protein YoxC|nr:hypothetical protein [Coriobacteriales bacterium]
MTEELLTPILIGVAILLLVVLIVAAIEIIRTVRKVRRTVDDVMPSLSDAVVKFNGAFDTLEPSLKRIDPLLERVSLTVDAVNLEIMRADQILADISDVTDVASGTAKRVSGIAEAPLNLLTSATDKIRSVFSDRKPEQKTARALGSGEGAHTAKGKSTKAERVAKFAPNESTGNAAHFKQEPAASAVPADGVPAGEAAKPLVAVADSAVQGGGESSGGATLIVGSHTAPADAAATAAPASASEQGETPVAESVAEPEPVLEQVTLNIEQQVEVTAQTPASEVVSGATFSPATSAVPTRKSTTPPPGAASTPPPSIPRSRGTAPPRW